MSEAVAPSFLGGMYRALSASLPAVRPTSFTNSARGGISELNVLDAPDQAIAVTGTSIDLRPQSASWTAQHLKDKIRSRFRFTGTNTTSIQPNSIVATGSYLLPNAVSLAKETYFLLCELGTQNLMFDSKNPDYSLNWPIEKAVHLLGAGAMPPALFLVDPDETNQTSLSRLIGIPRTRGEPILGDLIAYLQTATSLTYGKQLAARILELIGDAETEDEEISAKSLSSLILFLDNNSTFVRPNLAATPDGYLIANWSKRGEGRINVHFLKDGRVLYYAFFPNPKNPQKQDHLNGSTTADALGSTVLVRRVAHLLTP